MRGQYVREVMTPKVTTLPATALVTEAAQRMRADAFQSGLRGVVCFVGCDSVMWPRWVLGDSSHRRNTTTLTSGS